MTKDTSHFCPVCGKTMFSEYDSYEICDFCGWEDEAMQEEDPDLHGGFAAYLFAGGALLFLYILLFALFWRKSHLAKALALSVLPTLLFLACGVLFLHIPLIVFATIFGYAHITISCKNVKYI